MKKSISIVCLLIGLISCDLKSHHHDNYFTIHWPTSLASEIILSSIFSSVDYIVLQHSQDVFIGNIDKIMNHDSIFFILDKELMNTLFIYSEDGRFVGKVEPGLGAEGEILGIEDYGIDTDNGIIYILENSGKRIFHTISPVSISKPFDWMPLFMEFVGARTVLNLSVSAM
jgi:hypothetical protein